MPKQGATFRPQNRPTRGSNSWPAPPTLRQRSPISWLKPRLYFHRGGERAIIRHLDGRHLKTHRWRTELFYRRLDFNENIISSLRVATFPTIALQKSDLLFNRVLSNLRNNNRGNETNRWNLHELLYYRGFLIRGGKIKTGEFASSSVSDRKSNFSTRNSFFFANWRDWMRGGEKKEKNRDSEKGRTIVSGSFYDFLF